MPLAPTLPISSLSIRMQQEVLLTSFFESMASREVNAHTLSSWPYAITMLRSSPHTLALPAGTTSSSAERKSPSSIP